MTCPNCGNQTRVGATFCGECGIRLPAADILVAVAPAAAPTILAPPPPPPPPPPLPGVLDAEVVAMTAFPAAPAAAPATALAPPPPPPPPAVAPSNPFITAPPMSIPVVNRPVTVSAALISPVLLPPAPPAQEADLDATRVSVRRKATPSWRLVLPDGRHITVEKSVLIGRDAAPNAKWPGAQLLSIIDPATSVSKTHAAIEIDSEGLWVTDLNSTNGVVVTQPDGAEFDLDPDDRVQVEPGADIELGDYVIQVEKD